MVEKKIAHYPLEDVFACIATLDEMCSVIKKLSVKDLHKSMTTHKDHTVWQDVYRPFLDNGTQTYIKLTITNGLLIVSFKEK